MGAGEEEEDSGSVHVQVVRSTLIKERGRKEVVQINERRGEARRLLTFLFESTLELFFSPQKIVSSNGGLVLPFETVGVDGVLGLNHGCAPCDVWRGRGDQARHQVMDIYIYGADRLKRCPGWEPHGAGRIYVTRYILQAVRFNQCPGWQPHGAGRIYVSRATYLKLCFGW